MELVASSHYLCFHLTIIMPIRGAILISKMDLARCLTLCERCKGANGVWILWIGMLLFGCARCCSSCCCCCLLLSRHRVELATKGESGVVSRLSVRWWWWFRLCRVGVTGTNDPSLVLHFVTSELLAELQYSGVSAMEVVPWWWWLFLLSLCTRSRCAQSWRQLVPVRRQAS